jgi:exopolyphosphatase
MPSPLLTFLSQTRSTLLRPSISTPPSTFVLGNPSCDLDSFISAVVYAFFRSRFGRRSGEEPRWHVPILNLPTTPSGELWRLRPEFGTALRFSLHGQQGRKTERRDDADKKLLENLITISDIKSSQRSPIQHLFASEEAQSASSNSKPRRQDVVLVDHNALSVPDVQTSELTSRFVIVGCIDHHIDEHQVPSSASPRIIRTGIGSCTTLINLYLKDEGFWADLSNHHENVDGDAVAAVELAKLSLAAILIDTADLTAEGKVSDTDREIVAFLEDVIRTASGASAVSSTTDTSSSWDRKSFYGEVAKSKEESLILLTLQETFQRDYKVWTEKSSSNKDVELKLGIASVVKPLSWLVQKAEDKSARGFVDAMQKYAEGEQLDIFAIMTAFLDDAGDFRRELLVLATAQDKDKRNLVLKAMDEFESKGKDELKLKDWEEEKELTNILSASPREGEKKEEDGEQRARGKIWRQKDVSKSRKQVGPLLREAMKSV